MCKGMSAHSSPSQFERLAQLAREDAKRFDHLRRAMIAELIERPDVSFIDLSALQREIDCLLAPSQTLRQSMEVMMQLLQERVAELQQLSEKLAQLRATPSN